MPDIILQGYYISAAASGAPADIQFSPQNASPQANPVNMRGEKVTLRTTKGFDCSFFGNVASCTQWDIIFRQRG